MSFMNKIFGIKKENNHVGQDHHGPAAVKETVDEGFIVYQHSNAAVIENNQVQGNHLCLSDVWISTCMLITAFSLYTRIFIAILSWYR